MISKGEETDTQVCKDGHQFKDFYWNLTDQKDTFKSTPISLAGYCEPMGNNFHACMTQVPKISISRSISRRLS